MTEYVIGNEEGIVEDGIYSLEEAQRRIAAYDPEDCLEILRAEEFDADGNWTGGQDDD